MCTGPCRAGLDPKVRAVPSLARSRSLSPIDRTVRSILIFLVIFVAGSSSGNSSGNAEGQPGPALQSELSFSEPAAWLAEAPPSKLAELQKARFLPPPIEFPAEEFSFVLVGYTREIRVVDVDMLFRLEAPGLHRSLVSFEFIF